MRVRFVVLMVHPLEDARRRIEALTPARVHARSNSIAAHRRYWQDGYRDAIASALGTVTGVRHDSHQEAHSIARSWSSAIPHTASSGLGRIPSGVSHLLVEDALKPSTDYEHARALQAVVAAYAPIIDHLTGPHSPHKGPPHSATIHRSFRASFGDDLRSPLDEAHRRIRPRSSRPHLDAFYPRHWHHSRSGYAQALSDALTQIEAARQVSHRNFQHITILWPPRYLRKLRHRLTDPLASQIRAGSIWPPRNPQITIGPLPSQVPHRLIEEALDAATDSQRTDAVRAIVAAYVPIIDRLTEPLTLPCDLPHPDHINPSTAT